MHTLEAAKLVAQEAGRILAALYEEPHDITVKGPRDITTEADLKAEARAAEIIHTLYPEHRIVSEEAYNHISDEDAPTWYIDPLDGTTNYARGYPMFSISVALAEHGEVQCGVVYHPLLKHLFWAERGHGAYLNGRRLQVSARSRMEEAIVLLDWPRDAALRERSVRFLSRLVPLTDAVRSGGSAALSFCAIAAGWADIYYQYTLQPWDVAAGMLIAQEAGAMVTDLSGNPASLYKKDWLVTNGLIHREVLALEPWG